MLGYYACPRVKPGSGSVAGDVIVNKLEQWEKS